jgi:TatD DNase family protein
VSIERFLGAEAVLHCAALRNIGHAMLIDTHCHLDDRRYDDDRGAIIARAREAGIEAFVTIGCDLATSRAAVALAAQHSFVFASVGVHPHEARQIEDHWYDELRRLAQHKKVVAYGEIGLDYHYNHSSPRIQRERFREQILLARELCLPIVVHTREAQEDTIRLLKEERAEEVGGVFHCFSGDARLAKEALGLGFYLSFSGVVTFQNAAALRDIVKTVPLNRLLLETDCPYLTPVPRRGQRNEPAYVKLVAERMATLLWEDDPQAMDKISRLTTENARRLFKIPASAGSASGSP